MQYFLIIILTLLTFSSNAKNINLLDNQSFREQRNQWIVDYMSLKNFFNEELDINFLTCINLNFFSKNHNNKNDVICYKLHTTKEKIRQMMLYPEKSESNVILLSSFINNKQYIHVSIKQLFNIPEDFKDYFANCNFSIPIENLNNSNFNYQGIFKNEDQLICSINFFNSENNPTSATQNIYVEPSRLNSYSLY